MNLDEHMKLMQLDNKVRKISPQPRGYGKYMASLPNRKPIEELSDDDLVFWMFFERDGLIAMRNANEGNKLDNEIHAAEERFESYLNAVKDRMRKGGKRH